MCPSLAPSVSSSTMDSLADPWAADDAPLTAADVATVDALAHRAYIDADRTARREAESQLYAINIANCFAPPLAARAAFTWTTLMRHKLAQLRKQFGGCEPIDSAEMSRRLLAAV